MEKFSSMQYLFLEFLSYLTYQEIAKLREINNSLRERIDSINIWSKLIERDHANLIFLSNISTTASLSLLKNISQNEILTPTKTINIGSVNSLGRFQGELNENPALARNGFLGSIKEFVSNLGYCRFNVVAFPNINSAKCQKKIIETFLILSECSTGWEERLVNTLKEAENNGMNKIVIGLRLSSESKFVCELRDKYKFVVLVDALTLENIKKVMRMLLCVSSDMSVKNTDDDEEFPKKIVNEISMKESEDKGKKKKCEVF